MNFSVKKNCLLTVNEKGRDLIGVHKLAQFQGVFVAGKTRSQVDSVLTG